MKTGNLRLASEAIEIEVDVTSGATITRIARPGGPNCLFEADWVSPVRASRSRSYGDPTLDWLSEYRGGWHGLFPNAGAPAVIDGLSIPFHGELSLAEWEITERSERSVTLIAGCRLPLVLTRVITLDESAATLRIVESATNEGDDSVSFLWGHHPALDVSKGGVLDLPGCSLHVSPSWRPSHGDLVPDARGTWPSVEGKEGQVDLRSVPVQPTERLVFLSNLDAHWAAYRPASGDAVAIAWDGETFPHAWLWTQIMGAGFPWYGRPEIVAIEPQSAPDDAGLALHRDAGRALKLAPADQRTAWVTVSLFDATPHPVVDVDRSGRVTLEKEIP